MATDPHAPNPEPVQAASAEPAAAQVTEQSAAALTSEDRQWGMLAHLSGIIAGVVGLPFLGPLIVWLMKKDQSKFVDFHGKEALNFQLTLLIVYLISIPLVCVVVGIVTLIAAGIVGIVVPIIVGLKANNGEWYRIPYIIHFLK